MNKSDKKVVKKANKKTEKNTKQIIKIVENENKSNIKSKRKFKFHFNFSSRIIFNIFLFLILLFSGIVMILKCTEFVEEKSINYNERSNLDYKVYLKENDFYEESYLEKDMVYVASLIDKINLDFGYDFSSDKAASLNFTYDIIAKLVIADSTEKNSYFEKEYVLLEDKSIAMNNEKNISIFETVDIDYNYYNKVANNFKMSYGVDTISKLNVYLQIEKSNLNDYEYAIPDSSSMSISIPLSQRAINIKMDYNEIDNFNTIVSNAKVDINDNLYLVISIILIIMSIFPFIKFIKLVMLIRTKKNAYDKYINKIINEYDRLIVETSTYPDVEGKTIVKLNKFDELLDVRDILKLPIMYYTIAKHQKCYMYIVQNEKIYLLSIKAVDFENKE